VSGLLQPISANGAGSCDPCLLTGTSMPRLFDIAHHRLAPQVGETTRLSLVMGRHTGACLSAAVRIRTLPEHLIRYDATSYVSLGPPSFPPSPPGSSEWFRSKAFCKPMARHRRSSGWWRMKILVARCCCVWMIMIWKKK
jgi:hypothetical protein